MNRISNILRNIKQEKKENIVLREKRIEEYLEEKNKSEEQKQHEKHLRYINKHSTPMEIQIFESKKRTVKPGQEFEGN